MSLFFNIQDFLRRFQMPGTSQKIEKLLEKENCSLEELLDEEELLQEVKSGNTKLMKYFSDEKITLLLDYMLKEPNSDVYKEGHKYPFLACEILNCNCENIMALFFKNQKLEKINAEKNKYKEKEESKDSFNNEVIIKKIDGERDNDDSCSSEEFEEVIEENIPKEDEAIIEEKDKDNEEPNNNKDSKNNEIKELLPTSNDDKDENKKNDNTDTKDIENKNSNIKEESNKETEKEAIKEEYIEPIIDFDTSKYELLELFFDFLKKDSLSNPNPLTIMQQQTITTQGDSTLNETRTDKQGDNKKPEETKEKENRDDDDIEFFTSINNGSFNNKENKENKYSVEATYSDGLNEVLSGYFYRFFTSLYNRNPLQIFKYISETSPEILDNLIKRSNNHSITETISLIVDSSCFLEDDAEYEKYTTNFLKKIFTYVVSLSPEELLQKSALYSIIAEKFIFNKNVSVYLLREIDILKKIVNNCFLGIDLSLIPSGNITSTHLSKLNYDEFVKFKKIRQCSLDIITNLLNEASMNETNSVSEAYLFFKPLSVRQIMKTLINAYDKIEHFAWFYFDDEVEAMNKTNLNITNINEEKDLRDSLANDEIDTVKENSKEDKKNQTLSEINENFKNKAKEVSKLNHEDLNLFFKVYEKTEVVKIFALISQVLLTKQTINTNTTTNTSNLNEILKSFDLLSQFKNHDGEDILVNTAIGDYISEIFVIFSFLFQLTDEKLLNHQNKTDDVKDKTMFSQTFNNKKNFCLGEEKVSYIKFFDALLKYFKHSSSLIGRIEKNLLKVIDVSVEYLICYPGNNIYQNHALNFFKTLLSFKPKENNSNDESVHKETQAVERKEKSKTVVYNHFKNLIKNTIKTVYYNKFEFINSNNKINEMYYHILVEVGFQMTSTCVEAEKKYNDLFKEEIDKLLDIGESKSKPLLDSDSNDEKANNDENVNLASPNKSPKKEDKEDNKGKEEEDSEWEELSQKINKAHKLFTDKLLQETKSSSWGFEGFKTGSNTKSVNFTFESKEESNKDKEYEINDIKKEENDFFYGNDEGKDIRDNKDLGCEKSAHEEIPESDKLKLGEMFTEMDWAYDFNNTKEIKDNDDDFNFNDNDFEFDNEVKPKQNQIIELTKNLGEADIQDYNNKDKKLDNQKDTKQSLEANEGKKDMIKIKNKNNKRLFIEMDNDDDDDYKHLQDKKKPLSTRNAQREANKIGSNKDNHITADLHKPNISLSGSKVSFPNTTKYNRRYSYQQAYNVTCNLRSSNPSTCSPFVTKKKLSFDNTNLDNNPISCEDIEFLDNNYWKSKNIITDEVDMLIGELINNQIPLNSKSVEKKNNNENSKKEIDSSCSSENLSGNRTDSNNSHSSPENNKETNK